MADVQTSYERAVAWLAHSHIRDSDGAYHSIYRPETKDCENWAGNQTCLLSTAGAVLALNSVGYDDLALQSAEHICQLAITSDGQLKGGLLSGRGSRLVFANWMSTAILALLHAHQRSQTDRFCKLAIEAGRFISERLQNTDGSINQNVFLGARTEWLRKFMRPRHVWLANSVEAFLRLYELTGEECFRAAANRFLQWLTKQQLADGSFPMYEHSVMSRAAAGLVQMNWSELLYGCRKKHPASHTQSIKALMLGGRVQEARRSVQWLVQGLSPNGLLYQYYFKDGTHSVEEDVMPSAHFGLVLLEYPELAGTERLLERIASGIVYAQISSRDPNADGAIRGLPLHPTFGEHAYCWDTVCSILFLQRLLRREGCA